MKFKLRWLWAAHYQQEVPQWTRDFCNWGPRKWLRFRRWDIQRFFWDYFYLLLFKGYKSKDMWGVDHAMFAWVLPRLKAFKALNREKYPGWCENEDNYAHRWERKGECTLEATGKCTICKFDEQRAVQKWEGILDDMIFAIQSYVDGHWDGPAFGGYSIGFWYPEKSKWISGTPEHKRAERGYELFCRHIFSLWD